MKKIMSLPLLALASSAACLIGSQSATLAQNGVKNAASLSDDEICTAVHSFLNSYYELDTVCSIPYMMSGYQFNITANVVDKVSMNSRYNNYSLSYTIESLSTAYSLASGEFFYAADSDGYAVENYISIENEIESRTVTDTDGDEVKFLGNYNSPFYYLAIKESAAIKDYFEINSAAGAYSLTLNEKGYKLLESSFNNFFNQFTYKYVANFDSKTHRRSIKNVEIALNAEGAPASMTFNRVESDFYGAIVESYECTFSALESVPTLSITESALTEEQATYLEDRITYYTNNAFIPGNFTQTTTINDYVVNDDYTSLIKEEYTYHNYYDDDYMIMLSDYAATDSSYGLTYIAAYYYSESYTSDAAYTLIGISPEQDFYGELSSSYSTYDYIYQFAPTLSVSSDFFTYSEEDSKKIYTFDISSFNYDDYYFSLALLESLLGEADPCVIIGYFVADSSYNFDFESLVYEFDEDGNMSITLNYMGYYGYACSFTTSFSEIGTTDVTALSETNDAVKDCLAILETA